MATVLGLSASAAVHATTYQLRFSGAFTMMGSYGSPVANSPSPYKDFGYQNGWFGARTPITGTMTYNTTTGTGSFTINGFQFFGNGVPNNALAYDVTIQAIGNGTCTNNDPAQSCQSGNLLMGNMLFDWNNVLLDYPVVNVWDATGLLNALPTAALGTVIQGVGAIPATDGIDFGSGGNSVFFRLGNAPLAVTTWNATPSSSCTFVGGVATSCAGVNPSGKLPLISDTVGASPIIGTSFAGFSPNFDITSLTVECIDNNCLNTPPALANRMPGPGATLVSPTAAINFTFTKKMKTPTVVTAFRLRDSGGTVIPGTLIENTNSPGMASNFRFNPTTPLVNTFTYTASVSTAALDENNVALGTAGSWSFTVGTPPPPGDCTTVPQAPVGSNFTMLNPDGQTFPEATNDIDYAFKINGVPVDINNAANQNTSVSDTKFNMTMATVLPQPFFGFTWIAHTIRVFAGPAAGQPPIEYVFDTTCTVAQIQAGISACNNGLDLNNGQTQRFMTMKVGAGQLGAHILFDWGKADPTTACGKANCNIDVVNVWSRNATWNKNPLNLSPAPAANVNKLFEGEKWAGPAGLTVNPKAIWQFVSTDPDGDGINGVKMVDGAFIGYGANFNLGASSSCLPTSQTAGADVEESGTFPSGGCSISRSPTAVSILDKSDWLLVAGFLAWLGALRKRFKRQALS